MVGKSLGHYEILEPLGSGGMGEVYRAHDRNLKRDVAIKVLPEDLAADEERLARLEREAHLLAALNHPNIASIYSLEESEGTRFLVLELVGGETLDQRLTKGALPVEEALEIARQIAEALETAHGEGIIHRDLKPSNVKITPNGKAKVLDFGLAKVYEAVKASEEDLTHSPTVRVDETRTGVVLGTAAYMSPEQAKGQPLDKRTDIWSFGCVLYEMLAGRRPFAADDVSETMAAILKEKPDWSTLPDTTPLTAQALLRRCLRKDPNRRLHDIADARIETEEALLEPSAGLPSAFAVSVKPQLWRKAVLGSLLVMAGFVVGVAVWSLWSGASGAPRRPVRLTLSLPSSQRLRPAWNRPTVAISPNGSQVVYVAERGGTMQLYLREIDQLQASVVPETEGAVGPFFSPDGQWVGFFANGKMKKVSVTGGAPITLCDVPEPWGATWAPNGTIIFSQRTSGLLSVSADGGDPEVLTTPLTPDGPHFWPQILPDGKAVLYAVATADAVTADDYLIAVLSLETSEQRILPERGSSPRYAPTGHLVYARAGSLRAARFDPQHLQVTGPSVEVVNGVVTVKSAGTRQYAFATNGTLVYVPGSPEADRNLVSADRQGAATPITSQAGGFFQLRLSPNGQQAAVNIGWANHDIWLYDLLRENLTRLTYRWDDHRPLWTPDGKRIIFSSDRAGSVNIFWKSADGSGRVEQLLQSDYEQQPGSISPDGRLLAFDELHPSTGYDIRLLPLEGERGPRDLIVTPFDERWPSFSPDGGWIAYVSNESGQNEVYVRPYPDTGKKHPISRDGGYDPSWAPTGRELFFRNGSKLMAVAIETGRDFSAGPPQQLLEGYLGSSGTYDVAPDGDHFLMVREPEQPEPTEIHVVLNWFEELKRLVPQGDSR